MDSAKRVLAESVYQHTSAQARHAPNQAGITPNELDIIHPHSESYRKTFFKKWFLSLI
jgi:hypothetical protein